MVGLTGASIAAAVWLDRPAIRAFDALTIAPDASGGRLSAWAEPAPEVPPDDGWLKERIAALRDRSPLWTDPTAHRVQILVTRVEPDGSLREHRFRTDAELFYPASTVKTFVAVAALRELERLGEREPSLSLDTPLFLCRLGEESCRITADPTHEATGRITVGHEIRKMMLVSNNVAYSRLYDFVGHHRLNETFHAMGLSSVRIRTRSHGRAQGGRVSPPFEIGGIRIPERVSELPLKPAPAARPMVGESFYEEGKLEERPADFRFKNYVSMRDLQRLLLGLVRPDLDGAPDLGISDAHRAFLLAAMEQDPRASEDPEYEGTRYDIERYKTLLAGARRVASASDLRCVSKSGRAYGFEVDNAYIEHRPTGRAMFVTVAVYANPNRVINDNGYAYHLTRPFVEALGEELTRAALR